MPDQEPLHQLITKSMHDMDEDELREHTKRLRDFTTRTKQSLKDESEGRKRAKGFIYILSNTSMPNIFKVGYTQHTVSKRAKELSSNSSIPTPFIIEAEYPIYQYPHKVEKAVHNQLDPFRVSNQREFFKYPLDLLKNEVQEVIDKQTIST